MVDVAGQDGVEQRVSIGIPQSSNDHRRLPGQFLVLVLSSQREDQRDRIGQLTTCHERECLGRDGVEPLRVIDHAHQRLLLRHVGEQTQHGESDQESVRRLPGVHPESRRQRITLRLGQAIEMLQHRRAQLVQAGEGQLHLGLDARRSGEPANSARVHSPGNPAEPSCRRRPRRAVSAPGSRRLRSPATRASRVAHSLCLPRSSVDSRGDVTGNLRRILSQPRQDNRWHDDL